MRVSEFYHLNREQESLEFVNVHIDRDVPCFIDPGALRFLTTTMAHSCTSLVQSFFSQVLAFMREDRHDDARDLLSKLGEVNETRLGFSKGAVRGRGMGEFLAAKMWDALSSSRAVASGILRDLEETALFVEGVDRDIISDVLTNIIRGQLIDFTNDVCLKYGIPTVDGVTTKEWDRIEARWVVRECSLPLPGELPLLLVPRMFVRRRRGTFSADAYYRHYIIPSLQEEHLSTGSSLVRLLRSGEVRPPTKKKIMGLHPEVKPTNVRETEEKPELLQRYRNDVRHGFELIGMGELSETLRGPQPNFSSLLEDVLAVEPGADGATAYHKAAEKLLTAILYPALDMPVIEHEVYDGRKRIDIQYTNVARKGFFHWLHSTHGVPCSFVPVECKNYSKRLRNPEYDQLTGRFSIQTGVVGVLCYRGISNKAEVLAHCRDSATSGRGYIIALDDDDLTSLVEERSKIDSGEDFKFLYERFRSLLQ